jgi:uncharacterized membrane protein
MIYDTPEQVETHAARIHLQTAVLKVMPPGNLTRMSDDERAAIDRWFQARRGPRNEPRHPRSAR